MAIFYSTLEIQAYSEYYAIIYRDAPYYATGLGLGVPCTHLTQGLGECVGWHVLNIYSFSHGMYALSNSHLTSDLIKGLLLK